MKFYIPLGLFIVGLLSFFPTHNTGALGLKVAPLEYKTTLKANERKQGYVDVSNPSTQTVTVKTSVQAFKQIDDDGGLQFYDDHKVTAGIKNDLTDFELGPREALRMSFTIDGNALPEGDVFAAIFFTTEPKQAQNGVGQLVKVGTLLSLVNKNRGPRSATVTGLAVPSIQFNERISGSYGIKNSGPEGTGFYPSVTISSWPVGKPKQLESSLVFGARERQNGFTYDSGFGIHRINVSYGDSVKSQWVVTIAPWMLIALLLLIVIIGIELLLLKKRRKSTRQALVTTPDN